MASPCNSAAIACRRKDFSLSRGWATSTPRSNCAGRAGSCRSGVGPAGRCGSAGRARRKATRLNERVGRCVVPIGRHSLMNGVSARNDSHEEIEFLVGELPILFDAMGAIARWPGRSSGTTSWSPAIPMTSTWICRPTWLGSMRPPPRRTGSLRWWRTCSSRRRPCLRPVTSPRGDSFATERHPFTLFQPPAASRQPPAASRQPPGASRRL